MIKVQPGDALLYIAATAPHPSWFGRLFSWLVKVVTRRDGSHVEVYIGGGKSVGARVTGVHQYATYTDGLVAVLRPLAPLDLPKSLAWFNVPYDHATKTGVNGAPYDFEALTHFLPGAKVTDTPALQICSEFTVRFWEAGGFFPFAASVIADGIDPGMLRMSPLVLSLPVTGAEPVEL